VAVDLRPGLDDVRQALLEAAAGVLANVPGARLACLNVMKSSLIAIDENVDAAGDNIHVQRLAELRRWAEPLQLPRGKVTFHLVESLSVAGGILNFARSNQVHHLVIGALSGTSRRATQIMTEAPCTVTVVRTGKPPRVAPTDPRAAPAQ
jgi:nucleotide-binding universal stress UspA family protein